MILLYALAQVSSNSDVSVTIQPPSFFIQSECFVQPFTDEGGCILTETPEFYCETWASAYQKIKTEGLHIHSLQNTQSLKLTYPQTSPYFLHISFKSNSSL